MNNSTHYDTLQVSPSATIAQIKQSYRRLVKLFHPDSQSQSADPEQIILINAAYEVLSDPQKRHLYDRQLHSIPLSPQQQPADDRHYQTRGKDADERLQQWLKQVYAPVDRILCGILYSLNEQIEELSADPFDDELMEEFQAYLEDCRGDLQRAQRIFRSLPNPATVAGVAASVYYSLDRVSDGLEELNFFTLNYSDRYLHTGQELFRIANQLRKEGQTALKTVA
ncbi:MAG: J domain-containing protein [Cyanosarcina radialis HA8281-LM2]|jgi:molecular chaperone DnaJ|nr:J domain-containing protein [Cyanosarcina radialis HA8281-LM2]